MTFLNIEFINFHHKRQLFCLAQMRTSAYKRGIVVKRINYQKKDKFVEVERKLKEDRNITIFLSNLLFLVPREGI